MRGELLCCGARIREDIVGPFWLREFLSRGAKDGILRHHDLAKVEKKLLNVGDGE